MILIVNSNRLSKDNSPKLTNTIMSSKYLDKAKSKTITLKIPIHEDDGADDEKVHSNQEQDLSTKENNNRKKGDKT